MRTNLPLPLSLRTQFPPSRPWVAPMPPRDTANDIRVPVYYNDGQFAFNLEGTSRAVRCASAIAEDGIFPDVRWALEVLNTYGHLVPHAADK